MLGFPASHVSELGGGVKNPEKEIVPSTQNHPSVFFSWGVGRSETRFAEHEGSETSSFQSKQWWEKNHQSWGAKHLSCEKNPDGYGFHEIFHEILVV